MAINPPILMTAYIQNQRNRAQDWARRMISYADSDQLVIVDTETTGLSASKDDVIQIGVIDGDSGEELFSNYLYPACPIHPKAQAKHGISLDYLKEIGAPKFPDIHEELNKVLEDKVAIAYSASFDAYFLQRLCSQYDLPAFEVQWWEDAMQPISDYIGVYDSGRRNCRWIKLSQVEGMDYLLRTGSMSEIVKDDQLHDAVYDCKLVLAQILRML